MPLKQFTIDFKEFAKDFFVRSDFDYFEIKDKLNLDGVPKLKKYLKFLETGKPITPDDYSNNKTNNIHIVVRNIINGCFEENNLIFIDDEKAEELERYRIEKGDIVIAISSNCGSSFYYDGRDERNLTLSHYLARFKVNEKFINPVFLNYYINSKILKQYFRSAETGKTLKNLSKYYIKELPILIPDINAQDKIVAQIEPIEKKIKELKNQVAPAQEVINKVFAREFGFDLGKVYKIDNNKRFYVALPKIGFKNDNIRSSYRWNQLKRVQEELYRGNKFIQLLGKFIKNTKNGWSPECNGDENGQAVLGIDAIQKDGKLVFNNLKYTQQAKNNISDFFIKDGDFFVSRGNTIDLVALASVACIGDEDQDLIYPDLMIKIEFSEKKIDKKYLAFLFNSIIGRIYFKYSAKGKNQTMVKISSKELYDFNLPIPDLKIQQKIVSEIKAELDRQEEMNKKIETERNKIDEIIEKAIK